MAYAYLGGGFPVEMKLSIQDAQLTYGKKRFDLLAAR
ncbi:MAG: hypothetical protein HRU22_13025 [Gammaproteobacteria bacterium]|nr:hypothetical protein [Gammaproteobacteria bacterium]